MTRGRKPGFKHPPQVRAKMSAASKAAWAAREEADLRPTQLRARAPAAPPLPSLSELLLGMAT